MGTVGPVILKKKPHKKLTYVNVYKFLFFDAIFLCDVTVRRGASLPSFSTQDVCTRSSLLTDVMDQSVHKTCTVGVQIIRETPEL